MLRKSGASIDYNVCTALTHARAHMPILVRSIWCPDSHPWDYSPTGGGLALPFPNGPPAAAAFEGPAHGGFPIAVTHGEHFKLWEVGNVANQCLSYLSSSGYPNNCESLVAGGRASGDVLANLTGHPQPTCGEPTNSNPTAGAANQTLRLRVDQAHSRLSLMYMLAPSPDWFTGLESVELCVDGTWAPQTIATQPYDAGIDSVATFTHVDTGPRSLAADPWNQGCCQDETVPPVVVHSIASAYGGAKDTPFSSGKGTVRPVAVFSISFATAPACAPTCTVVRCSLARPGFPLAPSMCPCYRLSLCPNASVSSG